MRQEQDRPAVTIGFCGQFGNVSRLHADRAAPPSERIRAALRRAGIDDQIIDGREGDDARRAVELEPDSGTTLNMLCWTLIKDGWAHTALPLCEQAVALEPESGAIVHSNATALEALGRMDEALPLYRRAWQLSPDDPEIAADYRRTHNP